MAARSIVPIVILSLALTLTAASKAESFREDCPPGNPLCNIWQPCDYTGSVQITCRDCETRIVCTPLGGWVYPCWEPGHHNCVEGGCVREPSPQCAPEPEATEPEPTNQPTQPPPTYQPTSEAPSTTGAQI